MISLVETIDVILLLIDDRMISNVFHGIFEKITGYSEKKYFWITEQLFVGTDLDSWRKNINMIKSLYDGEVKSVLNQYYEITKEVNYV